jgi:hypothetical protein
VRGRYVRKTYRRYIDKDVDPAWRNTGDRLVKKGFSMQPVGTGVEVGANATALDTPWGTLRVHATPDFVKQVRWCKVPAWELSVRLHWLLAQWYTFSTVWAQWSKTYCLACLLGYLSFCRSCTQCTKSLLPGKQLHRPARWMGRALDVGDGMARTLTGAVHPGAEFLLRFVYAGHTVRGSKAAQCTHR